MFNEKEYKAQWYKNHREEVIKRSKLWCENHPGYAKKWESEHKEQRKKDWKKYREEHKEYRNKCWREWASENKEKVLENHRKWMKTENGKAHDQRGQIKRRAKIKEIVNTLTTKEWLDILEKYNYECVYCGVEFDCENLPTKDHIIPISKGGNNTKENIVPACQSCNSKKGVKILSKGR